MRGYASCLLSPPTPTCAGSADRGHDGAASHGAQRRSRSRLGRTERRPPVQFGSAARGWGDRERAAVLPCALRNVDQAAATAGFPDADAIVTNEESQLRTDCDGHFNLRRFAVPG